MENSVEEESGQAKMMMFRGTDGLLREYEIISARDRITFFQKACPVLPIPLAIICCLLNIFPGLGTVIGVLSQLCCHRYESKPEKFFKHILNGLFVGLLQLGLAPFIIGFVWAIKFGVMMVQKANERQMEIIRESSSQN